MNISHKIEIIDGNKQLMLYVEYPADYEFGLDFDKVKKNITKVTDKVREYATKNLGGFSDTTALLVLNGIVIGTLMVNQVIADTKTKSNNTEISSTQTIENETSDDEILDSLKDEEKIIENTKTEETKQEEVKKQEETKKENKTHNTNTTNNTNKPTTPAPPTNNSTATKPTTNNSNNSSVNKPTTNTPSIPSSKTINVKLASGNIVNMSLEDYVVGVVGAEMPAAFSTEALKAQAVASRTYALKKTMSGAAISASTSDQAYNTVEQLKNKWGSSFNTYYSKIQNAVSSTKGQCLTYNGSYIEALFFSTSNGRTEDAVNVWGNSLPYLKSVDSSWDKNVSTFSNSKTISITQISSKLGVNISSVNDISINSRTVGNRVDSVTIGGKNFTGVKIRTLLALRSADFEVYQSGSSIIFKTRGYGHGVGMSQYGANEMAKSGYSYTQILKHYYTGVSIVTKE